MKRVISISLSSYKLIIIRKIFIRKDHRWFGRWTLLVHLQKDNANWKWFYIPLWKVKC